MVRFVRGPSTPAALVALLVLTIGIAATPVAVEAQGRGKLPRIAVPNPIAPEYFKDPRACPNGFMHGLRDLGDVDGQNVQLDYRHAGGETAPLPAMAADLVRQAPDVVWTHSGAAVRAVKRATTTIPIVFGSAINVVEEGLVTSLARPGGNVTGLELRDIELTGKRLELLKEALPAVTRVAVLVDPGLPGNERVPGQAEPEARALGTQLRRVEARKPEAFDAALASMVGSGIQAAIIMGWDDVRPSSATPPRLR